MGFDHKVIGTAWNVCFGGMTFVTLEKLGITGGNPTDVDPPGEGDAGTDKGHNLEFDRKQSWHWG